MDELIKNEGGKCPGSGRVCLTTEKRLWVKSSAEEVRLLLYKIFSFLMKKFLTVRMSRSGVRNITEYLLH